MHALSRGQPTRSVMIRCDPTAIVGGRHHDTDVLMQTVKTYDVHVVAESDLPFCRGSTMSFESRLRESAVLTAGN